VKWEDRQIGSRAAWLTIFLSIVLSIPQTGCTNNHTAVLRLATTTSTRDSGLLDKLIPRFEAEQGVRVDILAAGTGKALKLGEVGDVDVVLVHARAAEEAFMAAGHGVRRESLMFNYFELIGPPDDPAQIAGREPTVALKKIAEGKHRFVSRGDDSGTHKRELALWQRAGGRPEWNDYVETGQGMGATLWIADEMQAYVLADRGTYLFYREKINLIPLAAKTSEMKNPYGVMVVNPDKHPAIQGALADALVDFLISQEAQQIIADYQVAGETLFVPLRLSSPKDTKNEKK